MAGFMKSAIIGVLFFLIFLMASVTFSEENTAAQCAQFGLNGKYRDWDYGNNAARSKTGYWTIAAREFDAKWLVALGTRYNFKSGPIGQTFRSSDNDRCPWFFAPPCPSTIFASSPMCVYSTRPRIEPCVRNNEIRMNLYLVKQNGRVLQGWLHVEIELLDQTQGEIEVVYIQMRDEKFNAIGEFVTEEKEAGATCKPSQSYLATPKHYQFYPCSATGLREAKTSEAIMMAKKEYYFDKVELEQKKRIHEEPIAKGVHFLFKVLVN